MSAITKKQEPNKTFIVFAHDLRTKDETSEFLIKAKNKEGAEKFFKEDFGENYWSIQEIVMA